MPDRFAGLNVLVVGDAILDEYVFGKVERISPEAPVPILAQQRNEFKLGGAANVAANCAALGAKTTLTSIVGDDKDAEMLEEICKESKIETFFLKGKGRYTPRKTRFVSNGQQVLRVDKESKEEYESRSLTPMYEDRLYSIIDETDVVIVSDYNKGYVTKAIIEFLKEAEVPVVVDPKPVNMDFYEGVMLITPNRKEAAEMLGIKESSLDDSSVRSLALKLRSNILVTLGEDGMKLCCCSGGEVESFPAVAQEVFDVTGAGDTVIAVVSLAIAAGIDIKEACQLANKAAAQVVTKFGTATVSLESLGL